ncbi:hypothetical protein HK100_012035 [Physocladia obscura]|uniref:Uncharacterized protein n=1 Tax=Physocladia obscura TaxID=109957 RepID=A0AAD5XCT3_9FUNG|nr:hypothetical protein HK100_012035 [Physocladia obscura]
MGKELTRGEKAYRDDLFDSIVRNLESLHNNQWITTHSFGEHRRSFGWLTNQSNEHYVCAKHNSDAVTNREKNNLKPWHILRLDIDKDMLMQALLYDKSDLEGASSGRDPRSIAAVPAGIDASRIGGGGQGHSVSLMGRKISIGNSGPLYMAIEDFRAQTADDLDFRKVDNNWARGKINGREGLYPKSFVQKR